ncbi:putative ABC transporter ATP-binding protein [Neochlamydia sp. TUME1]|uniref:LPS export ABC transporter ATP-binding protein n=1 Tax=Neochlamydia sp. TUME1 TaxID=1478174 RepID=UPI00057CC259|nr:LPS export ABC transporter ATP-binding protein [Neochlamydia sp. TUME1]KIC72813.1 putative ABC transporter ATP-binding protein [Neochlamydia sp. TUME1]
MHNNEHNICLEVQDLQKSYNGRKVVNGLSFYVKKGEIVGLVGPNGAGKTTAFYMTVGLIRPDAGTVSFNQYDVTRSAMHMRARMGMGYLAQEPSVFRYLTVEENIMCILECLPLIKAERKLRLEKLLQELHLEPLAKKKAIALSGGERRRLEITRALVTDPTLLMLDEPFANIDPLSVHEVKQMISHLAQKNISILITDHNAREIFSIVDRSYLVSEGKVILSGTVDTLVNDQQARRTYLGEDFKL